MSRVIQVRDVPDEVHRELSEAAAAAGLSLTRYSLRELETVAKRARAARHNVQVIADVRARLGVVAPREEVLAALHEGRAVDAE